MVEKNNGLLIELINEDDKDDHGSESKKELVTIGRQLYREKKNDNALLVKESTMPPGEQKDPKGKCYPPLVLIH